MAMHLAQYNVARLRRGLHDPRMIRFGLGAKMINRAAARTAGYQWSRQDVLPDRWLATRSVWDSLEALRAFVYSGIHRRYLDRTTDWFLPSGEASVVLWQVSPGHEPTLDEARAQLDELRSAGPTDAAFDFRTAARFLAAEA